MDSVFQMSLSCYSQEYPEGPVGRTPRFHCCGQDPMPNQGTKILQAAWHGQKEKKNLTSLLPITATILIQANVILTWSALSSAFLLASLRLLSTLWSGWSLQMFSQIMTPLLPHLTPVLHRSLALHSHLPCCSHCGLLAFNTPTHQSSTQPSTYQHTNLNTTQLSTHEHTNLQHNTTLNTLTHQCQHNITFNNLQHTNLQHNLQHTNLQHNTTFNNLQHMNIPTLNTMQLSTHQPSTQPSTA